jgi:hypothetical protein
MLYKLLYQTGELSCNLSDYETARAVAKIMHSIKQVLFIVKMKPKQ